MSRNDKVLGFLWNFVFFQWCRSGPFGFNKFIKVLVADTVFSAEPHCIKVVSLYIPVDRYYVDSQNLCYFLWG